MTAMVEVSHLTKHFGSFTAVDDISFNVNKGEVLGFLGPNGAGKSTTMKMITGFLTPDRGTAKIHGDDILYAPVAAKKRIGYLPEGAPLYSDMTPVTFLDFVAEIRGLRGEEKRKRVNEVIHKVNLENVLHKSIDTLSKGFKRRVGLAQAILHDPEILILDEPTDGLDPNQKHEVRLLIKEMATEKAIILSTHILEEVDAICNQTIIIANRKVVTDGTPSELEAKSSLHNSIFLAIRTTTPQPITHALEKLAGVKSVENLGTSDALTQFRVYPAADQSLVAPISHLARDQKWEIEDLHVERGKLDEVFRSITTEQTALS